MKNTEKWYNSTGKHGETIISSRIRFARNLSNYPFPHRLNTSQKNEINHLIRDVILKSNSVLANEFDYIEMANITDEIAQSLVEKHLISNEFATDREGKALLLKKDESVSIMLCEEDHVRIQVMSAGMDLKNIYEIASKIDTLLDNELHFAYSPKLGYLTGCPTNLGTGMRASLMLHIPLLEATGEINRLLNMVTKIGFTLRGSYGEGSKSVGALYQLSNQITLGIDEKTTIENLESVAKQIMNKEKELREKVDKDQIEDRVYRSLGVLKYARSMSSKEFNDHLSDIRLGIALGIITDIPIEKVNTLFTECQPAVLMVNEKISDDPEKRDRIRAELVRKSL